MNGVIKTEIDEPQIPLFGFPLFNSGGIKKESETKSVFIDPHPYTWKYHLRYLFIFFILFLFSSRKVYQWLLSWDTLFTLKDRWNILELKLIYQSLVQFLLRFENFLER